MRDEYEGDFDTRRSLIYTLRFTAKTYLFGPITDVSKDIIKKVSIGYIGGDQTSSPSRDLSYTVEPRATKNYTGTIITNLSEDIDASSNTNYINVVDSTSIVSGTYIVIDNEEMYVESKSGNTIKVTRGSDNTTIASHVNGSAIKNIVSADNNLIQLGDDFGFSGS
jgi:hypothetical protein